MFVCITSSMFCYVLICIILLPSLYENNQVSATNFQPTNTFGNNFLKVSDFDNILEQETSEDDQPSLIQTREGKNTEDSSPTSICERCPQCSGCQDEISNAQKKLDIDKVKRDLGEAGAVFLKQFFATEDDETKEKASDEDKEKCAEGEDNGKDQAKDEEFKTEQDNAANLTNVTKTFLYDIEHPQPGNDTEKEKECREKEEEEKDKANDKKEKGIPHPKLAKAPRKSTAGLLDDILEMHFYKNSPEAKRRYSRRKKSVLLNLHARESNSKKSFKTPKKFNYIALLSNDKNIVQVPALRFTVVPESDSERRRRSDVFEPFFVSRYRKHSRYTKPKPQNIGCGKNCPHVPILFLNTVPGLRSDYNSDVYKRASNVSDNYVRDADLLIQDVTNYLKFNLVDTRKTMPFNAGILVNDNGADSSENKDTNSDKNVFKKEAKEEPIFNNVGQDEAEIKQDPSICGNEPGGMKNSVMSMEVAPSVENSFGETDA